jgi:hypothetical protein
MAKPALTFPFKSDEAHYEADACIVWCFDDRFSDLLEAFKKAVGIKRVDPVEVAGGSKWLTNETNPAIREHYLWQINASNQLHKTPKVILMVHAKCGAYGLKVSEAEEYARLTSDLNEAELFLRAHIPASMTIEKYVADFDGLHKV